MDKPILFKGLENFKIPKCDILVDSIHDENGKPFNKFKIKIISGEFINYKNDKKIGIVPDSNPEKDIVVALMELGDNPDTNKIVQFIKSYGFFLSHSNIEDEKYRDYSETAVKNYIRYIKKIVSLLNSYTVYSQMDNTDRKALDYTQLCNLLLDVIFTESFMLYDNSDSSVYMSDNNVLGLDYRDDFIFSSHNLGLPGYDLIYDDDGCPIGKYATYPFDDFIKYRNEGRISIFYDHHDFDKEPAPTWTNHYQKVVYTFLYHLLEREKLKYTVDIAYIYEDDELYNNLKKQNKLYEVPHIEDLNGSDKATISLQNELMLAIQTVVNEQINNIIKNIYPKLINSNDELILSWHFENLTYVLFMELLNVELGEFEYRKCCKDDCPLVGSYYFIIDSKNKTKKCYSQACRNRINKLLFDKNHSKK